MIWQTTRFKIDLMSPRVMGIVNVTPDSFSDGGRYADTRAALMHCERLLKEGADLLDIGGESTRPGAVPLPLAQESARVLPVLREALKLGVPLSVDTYKPQLMRAALDLGVDIVNDIWALRWRDGKDPLAANEVIAGYPGCGVCLMHMHGEPRTMQIQPMTEDVLPTVKDFLLQQAHSLELQGVDRSRIVLDPGIGFGKTVQQNFSLLARQTELLDLGYPLLAGWSRKSSLGAIAGLPTGLSLAPGIHERMAPSIAAAILSAERGASIIRVHDVLPTVQALQVLGAIIRPPAEN